MNLENDAKLFTTQTTDCRPKMIIDEIRLLVMFALVKESIVSRLEASLARSAFNLPFHTYVQKSYAVESGRIEDHISCSLRDGNFDTLIVFFHSNNQELLGLYSKNYQKLSNPKLLNAHLEGPLGVRFPTLPG